METSDFLSSLPPFLRRHLVPISLAVVGIVLIVIGFLPMLFHQSHEENEVIFEQGSEHEISVAGAATTPSIEKIHIDVSGAVAKPGVYSFEPDSRVQEAITAAGGFSDKANIEWIAKNLNLAAKLTDASKLYIPFVGEEGVIAANAGVASSGQSGSTGGLINVNTASQVQLESLPGIGPVTAQKIISARPYSAINDLMSKKAVSQSVFEKIKDQVSVN